MNTTPSSVPTARPAQYQRGRLTLASTRTAVTTTTVNATMPISGLGKPNADACGVIITEPQDSTGLMLHDGTYAGLIRISIFSTVSVSAAARPTTPAIRIQIALALPTGTSLRPSAAVTEGSASLGAVTVMGQAQARAALPGRAPAPAVRRRPSRGRCRRFP